MELVKERKSTDSTEKDDLIHTGIAGDHVVGGVYTTFCGLKKTIKRLIPAGDKSNPVTCEECLMKWKSRYGY